MRTAIRPIEFYETQAQGITCLLAALPRTECCHQPLRQRINPRRRQRPAAFRLGRVAMHDLWHRR